MLIDAVIDFVAPLMGPALGPLIGGFIFEGLNWVWVFWLLAGVCSVVTILSYFTVEVSPAILGLLRALRFGGEVCSHVRLPSLSLAIQETYAPAILAHRCDRLSRDSGKPYTFEGRDSRPLFTKIFTNLQRPPRLLLRQPIVLIMAIWQSVLLASMYTLFSKMQDMYGEDSPYGMSSQQVGLLNLGMVLGYLLSLIFIVPQIDRISNSLSQSKRFGNGTRKPEYRLPLANVGAVLLVISIFWFAWTVQRTHYLVSVAATVLFGFSIVAIFNTAQNYWIDAFEQYAASAIAAGTILRSFIGGAAPLLTEPLFEKLGWDWGWSVFGFIAILFLPAPLLFMRYGEWLRQRFEVKL